MIVRSFVCLFACLFVCSFIGLLVCLSVCVLVCVCLFVCLSSYCACLLASGFGCVCGSAYLRVCVFV